MKMWNFPDDTTIFLLRDINRHNRIQSILKSYEEASSSETAFQKFAPYGLGHIKIEVVNQGKWYGHNCTLKYLECILLIPSLITTTGAK